MYLKRSIAIILVFSLFGTACSTTSKYRSSTTKTLDIYGSGVLQYPVVGELDVDIEKVKGQAIGTGTNVNVDNLKVLAVKDASDKVDADILVEPIFEIYKEGSKITVIAEGFPAKYTEFRNIRSGDLPLLEAGQLQTAEVFQASETESTDNEGQSVSSNQNNNVFLYLALLSAGVAAVIMSN